MILSRLNKNLKEQNWFAVLLEIVIVVIGLLIAFQIDRWYEQAQENKREVSYLERLNENLSGDLRDMNLNLEFYGKVFDYGQLALAFGEGDNPDATNWEVLVALFHSSQIWELISSPSTYEELKSAGELSLIRSITLRNDMVYYYGAGFERYKQTIGINPPYRKMVRGLIPNQIQNYLWENCHETEIDTQILKNCDPAISNEQAKEIIDNIIVYPGLVGELRFYMSSIKVGLDPLKEQVKLSKKMIAEIEDQLGK